MKEFFARLMRLCYPPHCALCHRLLNEQEQGGRARALLQGVIYSEVLGRRPVKRYGGRKA